MKKSAAIFFQVVIVFIGIGTLAFMLWEPQIEGRNVHATLFEIYFKDPFWACAYTASILFFVALYQAFKALGNVRQNKTCSQATLKALRTIKYCAIVLLGLLLVAEAYLFIVQPGDDISGGVFMGLLLMVISGAIATVASILERRLQKGVDIRSGNN